MFTAQYYLIEYKLNLLIFKNSLQNYFLMLSKQCKIITFV